MIRHNDEFIQFYVRKMLRDIKPAGLNDLTLIIQAHPIITNIAQQAFLILYADRNKVGAGL